MRKWAAVFLTALLMTGAFFLPVRLSERDDQRLLNKPHIIRQEEREGFAESLQLTTAEKLLLLRSSGVSSVVLENETATVIYGAEKGVGTGVNTFALTPATPDLTPELEENSRKWEERLTRILSEIRSLQTLGALPYLWDASDGVACTSRHQILYIDQDSQVSFLVYSMYLTSPTYSMYLTADAKTFRLLSFRISWNKCPPPGWGFQGTARFGTAWRDYWDMDSVSSAWDTEYIRSVLEISDAVQNRSGSCSANADVAFAYGGQTLRVPLVNWVNSNQDGILEWNNL
ncbi:MAG: hypothetical protein K2O18_17775 [Oscillospiraceae bacterium]|nr:hypothetical protein [Oscillospiraceae bacterium]